MTPAKLLVGQNLIVFAIVIVGVWFATEWRAAELGIQPKLGSPWFILLGLPHLFAWWFWYVHYSPAIFNKAGAIAASSGLAGCIVAIVCSLWRAGRTGRSHLRILASGDRPGDRGGRLFRSAGVFRGRLGRTYLRHDRAYRCVAANHHA